MLGVGHWDGRIYDRKLFENGYAHATKKRVVGTKIKPSSSLKSLAGWILVCSTFYEDA